MPIRPTTAAACCTRRSQEGTGSRERLCVSNPGLIQAIANDIIAQADAHPDETCFSICPNDGGYSSFCLCDACRALDPPEAPKVKLLLFDKVGESKRKTIEYPSLTDRYIYFGYGYRREIEQALARQPLTAGCGQAGQFFGFPGQAAVLAFGSIKSPPSESFVWGRKLAE